MPASARGLCAATPLCARRRHRANVSAWGLPRHPAPVRGVAVISGCNFELSPPTRTMFLLPLLPSHETCPLSPPSEARTFRGALCEVSAFASRRWVCPRLPHAVFALCVRSEAARVAELVGASHEGDTHSPVAASVLWAKRRHRRWATSPRRWLCPPAACAQPLLARGFIALSALRPKRRDLVPLPPKTWRCDGVSLNCHCSAVLF